MIRSLNILFTICVFLLSSACSDDELTSEDRVHQLINAGEQAVESRNHSDLSVLIDDGYQDSRGQNKEQLVKRLRAYFFRHKNIELLVKVDDIRFSAPDHAHVIMHVAMAGNVATEAEILKSIRASIYKFELQLTYDGEWLLSHADWQMATLKDMLE